MDLMGYSFKDKEQTLSELGNVIKFSDSEKEKVDRYVRRVMADNQYGTSHIPFRVEIVVNDVNAKLNPKTVFENGLYVITGVDRNMAEHISEFVTALNYPCDFVTKSSLEKGSQQ